MNTTDTLYSKALQLSIFTIIYNFIEGIISISFGYEDEVLTLFGFGVDSFIEILSGIGIMTMILRIRKNPLSKISLFEIQALKITGFSFYILSIGLTAGIIINLTHEQSPETTFWGVIISGLSIIVMTWLVYAKRSVGKALNSTAIIADSNCTKICIYMSVVLLVSSLIYELTGFAYADIIGTAGLIYFSVNEGKEAFEKAKSGNYDCDKC